MKRAIFAVMLAASAMSSAQAMESLNDRELREVHAGETFQMPSGEVDNLALTLEAYDERNTVEDLIRDSMDAFSGATGLNFDFVIEGVHYADGAVSTMDASTGALTLSGPDTIDLIALRNLRTSATSPVIGDVTFHDIRFHTMNLTITPKP